MSLINLKKLLISITLVLVLTTEVFATQGFRPWAPYQRDQFGGGARRTEGVYGVLEGVYYTFAPSKNIVVGFNNRSGNPSGSVGWDPEMGIAFREVFTGDAIVRQTNTVSTNHLGVISGMGTRAEVGNHRGPHGWSVGGYSIMGMSSSMDTPNASMVIDDQTRLSVFSISGENLWYDYYYDPRTQGNWRAVEVNSQFPTGWSIPIMPHGPTSLWGWFLNRWDVDIARLAPLPINFENARVTTQIDHWVIDALYTYRCHPTRLGNLDVFGGVRYMEIDDSLNFLGTGSPWRGVSIDPETGELTGEVSGVGTVLGDSDWRFKADNHIIAPQIGGRWSRTNNRWTLSAEGRFLAGFNQQNLRSRGSFGSHYNNLDASIFDSQTVMDHDVFPWTPISLINGAKSFNHSKTHHAFSPGVEVKINANWQVTNAVGINFGVTGMWVDEIARGHKINDYTIYNNGQFFGLNNSGFTDSALLYGVNFGVTVNLF